ncbi:hypothetical protein ASD21_14070 [Caulobacter sp. Root1455]|uniref:hypothetical protein n=1 Tax=unclassified Caulobacter TaxID=2648921 RepID=UPI0006FD68A3|nr:MULTISPECIES: hypothetical protein [unclassified Caulobacter]KQY30219.1 hypothetical protein ASD38_13135 [Caulobacter sp. Root487D2Y]KQY92518.1 hypothetical protein ASD21_14070 [Caulobacter sp. Root1455]
MTPPTLTAPLSGCVSIDATTPDGYLDNARAGTPTAGAHSNIQAAAANLLACATRTSSPTTASLVGHGSMGVIATGAGGSLGTDKQYIGLDNQNVWAPLLQPLSGRFSGLYLYGVEIGAGVEGAQLLYALAKVMNTNVFGPTGLIYCDSRGNFTLESGSQWQVATPVTPPRPIAPPQFLPSLVAARGALVTASAAFDVTGRPLPQRSAAALAGEVAWTQPFQPPGAVSGLVTGRLRVGFGRGALKTYTIYNHALLRDNAQPAVFYRASSKFRAIALGR